MKSTMLTATTAALFILLPALRAQQQPITEETVRSIYDFTVEDIDGNQVSLERFRGMAMVIVNVASECGYTYQYEGLQNIYSEYKDRGLVVLGFPTNDFGEQEPGSNEEIKNFCSTKFHVTFPMFSKISVIGHEIHPLYAYLTSGGTDSQFAGEISWNFNKFVVNRSGNIVARFGSKNKPENPEVREAIETALK